MKTFIEICRICGALAGIVFWFGVILLFSLPVLVALFH